MCIYCTYIHILSNHITYTYIQMHRKKVTVTNWNLGPCCLVVSCRCTHHWNETKVTSLVLRGNGRCAQKKSKLLQAEKDEKSRNQNARCLQSESLVPSLKKNELQMFKKNFGTIISNVDSLGACSPLSWIFFYILQPLHPGASHQVDPVPAPSTQCLEPETFITTCACTVTLDRIEVWSQSYGLMETILGCCLGYFLGGGWKLTQFWGGILSAK